MIIRQIEEWEISNVVSRIHNEDDFIDGDLADRLEEYQYYNHESSCLVASLNFDNYDIDDDKVKDIIEEIKSNGIEKMPKIIIDENGNIIDGSHRAKALSLMNIPTIDVLRGTNKKFIPEFKKELIDEELKIVRISNEFGCIDIMENAKYSPATNSVANFQVDKKYQSLGIGTELLKEALRTYDDLGAQISSIASIKTFLKNGFDFNGNQPNTSQNFLRYDFNIFQKSPYLLNNKNNGIYKIDLDNFNNKFEQAINRFNENGGSVFLRFDNRIEPEIENKKRTRLKI